MVCRLALNPLSHTSQCPRRLSSKGKLRRTGQGPGTHSCWVNRRENCGCDLLPLSVPHGLIKEVQRKVVYWCQPSTAAQSGECQTQRALRVCAGNWAPVTIAAQTEPPSLVETLERENSAQYPITCRRWEDLQNWLGSLTTNKFGFFPPLHPRVGQQA